MSDDTLTVPFPLSLMTRTGDLGGESYDNNLWRILMFSMGQKIKE